MSKFIKLTVSANKTTLYMRAGDVKTVEKNPNNLMETVVMTSLITPRGPAMYAVMESQEEIMRQLDAAEGGGAAIAFN